MAEVLRFKISPTVAAFVRPGVTVEKKLAGIQAAPTLGPLERLTLLFCLLKDADTAVKAAAGASFSALPVEVVLSYVQAPEAHPSLLNELAKAHIGSPEVVNALLLCELLSIQAREFLHRHQVASAAQEEESSPLPACDEESEDDDQADAVASDEDDDDQSCAEDEMQDDDVAEIDEEDEEFLSKYKIAMIMGIGEKIKMALTGDKEWRAILVKDTNKLVSASVIKNPRITDGEILTLVKVGVQNDEILRLICANREWIKNYLIRKALVCCPKTPLPNALRYLATLTEKDIAFFAKSKNIPSVVSTQAKRILLSKKR
jgi:hypothetical protein